MAGGLLGKKPPVDEQDDLKIQADDDSPTGEEAAPEDTSDNGDGQATYDQFVKNCMKVLFDRKGLPTLLKGIAGPDGPIVGLARVLTMLLLRVAGSAQQAGTEIPDDVVQSAAKELIGHIADLAGEAGVHKFNPQELAKALKLALLAYQGMNNDGPPGAAAQQAPPPDGGEDQGPPARQPTGLMAAAA